MKISSLKVPDQIRLGDLLSALGHALDMTEGQPPAHCVRCCWIGTEIGRRIGLQGQALYDLYYTLLLKDLGCSSNAARICQLYLTDDLDFKRDFKLLDGNLPNILRFVLAHTGVKSNLSERFRAILNIFRNGGEIALELIETRCHRGADIARQLRFSENVAQGIHFLDERWDGSGKPSRLAGADIPLFARIALMAQVIDVFRQSHGPEAAMQEVRNRAGGWFDPALADAFLAVGQSGEFWQALSSPDLRERLLEMAPAQAQQGLDDDYLDEIVFAFAQVVDAKSPFTAGHSHRVALFADMIAEALGMPDMERRWLKRASLLHDIGKLGVSNTILDKPGKLDDDEWRAMKQHTVKTEAILERVHAFADFAFVAASHHERLDGKGYPRGLREAQIPFETRIITAADIFDALTADRPYRAAMPVAKALAIMRSDVGSAVDARCFNALTRALELARPELAA